MCTTSALLHFPAIAGFYIFPKCPFAAITSLDSHRHKHELIEEYVMDLFGKVRELKSDMYLS